MSLAGASVEAECQSSFQGSMFDSCALEHSAGRQDGGRSKVM